MTFRRGRSVRAHILGIVLIGAIVPLTMIGIWLTTSAVRSGKELLREQLDASGRSLATSIAKKWSFRQGELLLLANNVAARHVLTATPSTPVSVQDSAYLAGLYWRLSQTMPEFAYRDSVGRVRWSTASLPLSEAVGAPPRRAIGQTPSITTIVPAHDDHQRVIGRLEARVALDGIVSTDSGRLSVPGAILAVRDAGSGAVLTAGVPSSLLEHAGEFQIRDSTWIVVHHRIATPNLELILAAPTVAYVAPFERAARVGFAAVLLVAAVALALSIYLTTRLTRPLERLVDASSAVSRGDLERRVDVDGPREITALATSFNLMTESLNRTMAELSRRSALAAVGEFAASLAHEVRNALTSVKVDLQRAEEKLPPATASRELVARSLASVTNLDGAVTAALRLGRSGSVSPLEIDLSDVLTIAADRAGPTFAGVGATLDLAGAVERSVLVHGDSSALEQLFLNLFLNAAQALPAGGRARIETGVENGHVIVSVSDNGSGITPADLGRVLDPFFTRRPGGTGLGLPIAREIAVAHGGALSVESCVGTGTVVTVRLPRDPKPSARM